jgi:hypothetical protein
MARSRAWLPAAAFVLLAAAVSHATVLVPADLSELSRSAVAIVRGTVTVASPQWADGRRRVETLVTLQVQQVLKGEVGTTLTFKVPGGRMGRYRSMMVGAPGFQPGDEVVVFLGAVPPALPYLLGLGQGVYRIRRDSVGGATVLPPAVIAGGATSRVQRGDTSRKPLSLLEFMTRVRDAAASGANERRRVERPAERRTR